jgi:amino acid permease
MTAICGMISWTAILYTSLRWHKGLKVQGIDRNTLPYKAPFQPYLSYCKSNVHLQIASRLTKNRRPNSCHLRHDIRRFQHFQ